MKLYTYDPAPNPRRLQLFLDYKGIALDTARSTPCALCPRWHWMTARCSPK